MIYNTAPRYREAIFRAIDAEYDCDLYFGHTKSDIKVMDTSQLKNVAYYHTIGNDGILNGVRCWLSGRSINSICFEDLPL